ncbi:MAG: hypothetical protein M1409_04530 [Actinobacteria bacterium]|nr:hypothetical protein [Actinomycetota bacterium]
MKIKYKNWNRVKRILIVSGFSLILGLSLIPVFVHTNKPIPGLHLKTNGVHYARALESYSTKNHDIDINVDTLNVKKNNLNTKTISNFKDNIEGLPIHHSYFNQTTADTLQPILLQPIEINAPFVILENHPTEFSNANVSFEKIYYLKDYFSDKYGFRPLPWGNEIFAGKPEFLCDNTLSRSGKWSFKIIGKDRLDDGALAVPFIKFKPRVISGRYYLLSFWINYSVNDGNGVRLIQQFFRNDDFKNKKKGKRIYPSYACYGPWIIGTSYGRWMKYNLIAKAPDDVILGDPVIALQGTGKVNIDDAFFGEIQFLSF